MFVLPAGAGVIVSREVPGDARADARSSRTALSRSWSVSGVSGSRRSLLLPCLSLIL